MAKVHLPEIFKELYPEPATAAERLIRQQALMAVRALVSQNIDDINIEISKTPADNAFAHVRLRGRYEALQAVIDEVNAVVEEKNLFERQELSIERLKQAGKQNLFFAEPTEA